jgi:hypothetical protein
MYSNHEFPELNSQSLLAKYSFYALGRVQVLMSVRDEIVKQLDFAFQNPKRLSAENMLRAESFSWFWILGAYEVVRTMCQAKQCFSSRTQVKLFKIRKRLSKVRMPAAKMEPEGRHGAAAITSMRSPAGVDLPKRDLLVGDPRNPLSLRALFDQFGDVFNSLEADDILNSHESVYPSKSHEAK